MAAWRLQPDDVDAVRFATVRIAAGYHETEVDEFLTEVREDLRRRLQLLASRVDRADGAGRAGRVERDRALSGIRLTAESVEHKTFTMVRLREGYDPEDVDRFLDRVIEEFRALDRELRAG